jgi:hypothetical protein
VEAVYTYACIQRIKDESASAPDSELFTIDDSQGRRWFCVWIGRHRSNIWDLVGSTLLPNWRLRVLECPDLSSLAEELSKDENWASSQLQACIS